jgi:cAMP-dependent protein kinase regulator
MIEHLQQHYLPAETERYHTENFYGYKNTAPITYGIHGSFHEQEAAKKRERTATNEEEPANEEEEEGKRRRRGAISDVPSLVKTLDLSRFPPKSAEVVEVLERAAAVNPILKTLEREDREFLFRAMFEVNYREGDTIIREGDQGDNYYILSKGECIVTVKGVQVLQYKAGDSFGELALIHGVPRQATIVAKTDVTLWGLERTAYRATLMRLTVAKREKYGEFLQKVQLFSSLDRYDRMVMCDCLEPREFQDGEVILRQGEVGQTFFLIVSGKVSAVQRVGDQEGEVGTLGEGDYFGEIALLTDSPRKATCIAVGPVKCVCMDRGDFIRVVGPVKDLVHEKIPLYKKFLAEEDQETAPDSKEKQTKE